MPSKQVVALLLLGVVSVSAVCYGQLRRSVGTREFVRMGTKWYEDFSGDRYEVNSKTIMIKYRNGIADSILSRFNQANNILGVRNDGHGWAYLRLPANADPLDLVVAYLNSGLVEVAEPSVFGKYLGVPNDPLFSSQWHLTKIKMPQAWDIQTANPSIIVGILDSGTDWLHPDIGPGSDGFENIWLNETVGPYGTTENDWADPANPASGQGDDDDANGNAFHLYVDDWKGWDYNGGYLQESNDSRGLGKGHGTYVAGILGAKTNNGTGVAGVAGGFYGAGVRMMILSIGEFGVDPEDLADAIYYSAQRGARVIQLSVGWQTTIGTVSTALNIAHDTYRCLIVCASGNNNASAPLFPARHPKVVAVGATNENDFRCSPPDWEPECPGCGSNYGSQLDLAAPGKHIFTTLVGNGYGWDPADAGNGTSYSAPQVSGLAALLLYFNPNYTHDGLENVMKQTADKTGGYNYNWDPTRPGHSRELGYGRINAYKALSMANGNPRVPQNFSANIFYTEYNSHPRISWLRDPSHPQDVDVEQYEIWRRIISSPNPSQNPPWALLTTVGNTPTSYVDYSINYAGGGPYTVRYRVKAVDAAGLKSDFTDSVGVNFGNAYKPAVENKGTPIVFQLEQNYPNPFNPTTRIKYVLPRQTRVLVKVFDVSGREVKTLVDAVQDAGEKTLELNAADLSSGVYFYSLQAEGFIATKNLMVIR